jgi:CheY-like chemotaxis protein
MDQPKVLIVDDDPGCRLLLADLLCSEPYRLLEASNGPAALEVARQELPDLILLDVRMPAQDGLAVLRKLKEQDRTCHIPVIMVTALAEDSDVTANRVPRPWCGLACGRPCATARRPILGFPGAAS